MGVTGTNQGQGIGQFHGVVLNQRGQVRVGADFPVKLPAYQGGEAVLSV